MLYPQRGFTLFETLISIVLLAILFGMGIPALQHFLIENRLTLTANELIAHLRLARSEAIWRHQRVVVCPRQSNQDQCANDWAQGWMLFVDSNGNLKRDADESIVRLFGPLDANLSLQSGGRQQVVFQAHGRTPGSNATFTLCHLATPNSRQVILSGSGRTRVEKQPLCST